MSTSDSNERPDLARVRVHGIAAGALCIADSVVAMLGMTAMFALVTLAIGLPIIAFNAVRRRWARVQTRALIIAVYLSALFAVALIAGAQNMVARSRAETIIAAGKAYHSQFGEYPGGLDNLVPEFMEAVPKAKIVLYGGHFEYAKSSEGKHHLRWKEVGPFRTQYEFETAAWSRVED